MNFLSTLQKQLLEAALPPKGVLVSVQVTEFLQEGQTAYTATYQYEGSRKVLTWFPDIERWM